MPDVDPLLEARARVLRDLSARAADTAAGVSLLDEAVASREWWLREWPDGRAYVACLIAQDVQEALKDAGSPWPLCIGHEGSAPHELRVSPDLGEDPHWVCEEAGQVVAPVGGLACGQLRGEDGELP